jgi:hypothetical protein
VLALRWIPIAISLGCLTSLTADNPRLCGDPVACRWPAASEEFQQPEAAAAEAWINGIAAGEGFAVESVQHYPEPAGQ